MGNVQSEVERVSWEVKVHEAEEEEAVLVCLLALFGNVKWVVSTEGQTAKGYAEEDVKELQ